MKESKETEHWLELLYETAYFCKTHFDSIYSDNKEPVNVFTSIVKSAKTNKE